MCDYVALESHASDKQLNLIIFDLEVSVFYNFYKKMNLFVIIVGLRRPTYIFFITFVSGIIKTEYRNYANFAFEQFVITDGHNNIKGKQLFIPYSKHRNLFREGLIQV